MDTLYHNPKRRAPRGLSLLELVLALAAVSGLLGTLAVVANNVRSENADQQTRQILRTLAKALNEYQAANHQYPPPPADIAIHYLQTDRASEPYLRTLHVVADEKGLATLCDGYGRALAYIPPRSPGRPPDFVSAGRDGQFGDLGTHGPDDHTSFRDRQATLDNVYSSELEQPAP